MKLMELISSSLDEIIPMVSIIPLPKSPLFLEGVINLRGKVIPIIDLRKQFGCKREAYTLDTRIILTTFSSKTVSDVSGRGVGMDVVKASLAKVEGRVKLETKEGRYSRFILSLPLTLAVTKSILVKSAGEIICFPMMRVEEVRVIAQDEVQTIEGRDSVDIRGEIISLVHLSALWGLTKESRPSEKKHLVIVGQNQEKVALCVEEFLGEKDIVNKPLDRRLKNVWDIAGGTILDDGKIAYVVDVDSLVRSSSDYTGKALVSRQEEELEAHCLKILVVEDSLTVRELEKKVLESKGYKVVAAVDGQDGWNKVREEKFDLVITDIEMPRMNGFELIRLLKKDESLCDIPTIIVSFKESEEDKGMEAGADKYITKSQYNDKILLESIEMLIRHD
jgi:two-component system, chemotaxis family, sensor histidine kinase and response regulator WspE